MKEWIMKHPILTFLLVDGAIAGLFKTIQSFAPKQEDIPKEEAAEEDPEANLTVQIDANKEESK